MAVTTNCAHIISRTGQLQVSCVVHFSVRVHNFASGFSLAFHNVIHSRRTPIHCLFHEKNAPPNQKKNIVLIRARLVRNFFNDIFF